MVKQKRFEDPLEDIDPVMEQAFSVNEDDEEIIADKEPVSVSRTRGKKSKKAEEKQENLYDEVETPVSKVQFPNLNSSDIGRKIDAENIFSKIPVNVSVELGRSKITLKEVYEITEGSIIELERMVGEPLDLVVNGQVIAQGEVVAIDNNYGLRITNIVSNNQS
jgi:flagellar motor switch protein FliN